MGGFTTYAVIAGGCGLLAFILLLAAIRKKSMKMLYACLLAVLLTLLAGGWAGYLALSGAYNEWEETDIKSPLRGRTGTQIYTALFGPPQSSCVEVLHKMDPVLPRIDNMLCLQFNTCPEELERIIAQQSFESISGKDGGSPVTDWSGLPQWFEPRLLGADFKTLRKGEHPGHPGSAHLLYISGDSTHALYVSMQD